MAILCLLRVLSCWSESITDLGLLFFNLVDVLHETKCILKKILASWGQTKVTFLYYIKINLSFVQVYKFKILHCYFAICKKNNNNLSICQCAISY